MSESKVNQSIDEKQAQPEQQKQEDDGFTPKKNPEEYIDLWRKASAEAKKYRQERAALKQKLEEIEQKTLQEQGKYKEMYERASQELNALKGAAKRGAVKQKLTEALLQLGCNPKFADKALRLADLDEIQVDPETFLPDEDQVKFEAQRIKEELPVLFGGAVAKPKDGIPSETSVPKKSFREMKDEELDKLYKEALRESLNG